MRQHGMQYVVVLGDQTTNGRYGRGAMPLTLLIDREGRIAFSHSGVVDKGEFEKALRAVLYTK